MADRIEITDEMRARIGEESPPWPWEVTRTSVRAFARGVGYTDPVYFDLEAARRAGYRDLPAPPTYLGTPVYVPGKSHETFSAPVEGIPAVRHGLRNVLDGGTETEVFEPICAGDELVVTSRISDLEVKTSKALGAMLVITSELVVRDRDGRTVAIQRGQGIHY